MPDKFNVFISYSRKDKRIVEEFCDIFSKSGITYWIDKVGIENGENFKSVIVKAIEDATVFVFFSSVNSNASQWTAKEIGIAVARKKTIIPIKLDNSPFNKDVEFDLVNLDILEYQNKNKQIQSIEKLLLSIKNRCKETDIDTSIIREHYKLKRQKKNRLIIFSVLLLCFFTCIGMWSYKYIVHTKTLRINKIRADEFIREADTFVANEMNKCFYKNDTKCYDSITPSNFKCALNLYDSAYIILQPDDSILLNINTKKEKLQSVIDSMYRYYIDNYNTCIETQREIAAKKYKERIVLMDSLLYTKQI